MRRIPAVIGLLLVASPIGASQPNVLLITVDALRPDRLGCMDYPHRLTPTLDSLAAAGTVFTNAFTSSAWTSPALVSCLTGRHEPAHGVDTREKSLAPGVPTLPGELVKAGYHAPDVCYLVGSPNYQNLDFQAFDRKQEFLTAGHEIMFRWLETYAPSHQPFFLYYHYRDLHQPYAPSPPFDTRYLPDQRPPDDPEALARFTAVRTALLLPEGRLAFSPSDTGWVRGLYDGEVAEADARFFRPLLHQLRMLGIAENTLVIISADHGEELLEHGNVGHASTSLTSTLYDEELRIPLIVSWPAATTVGHVVRDMVQLVDVMPTVLDLTGIPVPEGIQGRSLRPLIEGEGLAPRPVYVSSVLGGYQATAQMQGIRLRAVRTDRWKLVRRDDQTLGSSRTLYDLAHDPSERVDCTTTHAGVADSLEGLLETWLARCRTLYRQPLWAGGEGRQGSAVRPTVLSPQTGDSLRFDSSKGMLGVRLQGTGAGDYDIQYSVGTGSYHVEGVIPSAPDGVFYGPFTPTFWNTLVGYNPWAFRVMPSGRSDLATDWVTFYLQPSDP
ncbi:MAG: sulfatase [Candidatus Eisenbacteria bacterium]|nr:sulfatase [Candidatus Eisenbacteria bacterium]